jgi:hypothetical protein
VCGEKFSQLVHRSKHVDRKHPERKDT